MIKELTTVRVDLAKAVLSVHGVDAMGRVVLRKTVRRVFECFSVCLEVREACGALRGVRPNNVIAPGP